MTELELQEYLKSMYPQEDTCCEWKEMKNLKNSFAGKEADDVISYVSAIANMEGGCLVIGVKDGTLEIVGTDLSSFNLNSRSAVFNLTEKCTNLSTEGLYIEEFVTEDSGKVVWVFHIPKHLPRRPVYAHRKAWQRVADSLVEMKPWRMENILRERLGEEDWSAEVIDGAEIGWLDEEAVLMARKGFKERFPELSDEVDGWDDAVFLDKAKLTLNRKITKTALLLLGKDECVPYLGHIAQIVWKLNTENETAGDIFSLPFLTATDKVLKKIRNYRFKIYPHTTLIPAEVWKYDTKTVLEALHNCIAHQDYSRNSRIVVTEHLNELVFSNEGSFYAGSYEDYIQGEKTPDHYRNPFLVNAMVNLKMIDTQGYGIHNMYLSQKRRYLPMPDYDLSEPNRVVLHLPGNVIDENYSLALINNADIDLTDAVLLDKVQKHQSISNEALEKLRSKRLVEGRKPNIYVSKSVAAVTNSEVEYSLNKGLDDKYYKDLLLKAIKDHKRLSRRQIEMLLVSKFPDSLSENQKKVKVSTLLEALRRQGKIKVGDGRKWQLAN